MQPILITPLYAGLLGLVLLALSAYVIRVRLRYQVGVGDGGKPELTQAMRVQANFVEYTPLTLLLIVLVEGAGGSAWLVHGLGASLTLGRVLHALGLGSRPGRSPGRALGMLLTWAPLLTASIALIEFAVTR